ncbi:MAG: uL15 family ribosomal protein [Candidatus Bathyarchaeia archaeon]
MPHKLRQVRKMRGSRTHGWGQIGQHRKSGSRGGKGRPGLHKHGWTYVLRYEPDHFSKDKFKPPNQKQPRIINLKQLEEIIYRQTKTKKAKTGKITIDLKEIGYDKLLGSGKISVPITVKVPSCSEEAKKKIEEAGGEVITEAA